MLIHRRAIKEPGSTPLTSGGITQDINSKPIRTFLVDYSNRYVTMQSGSLALCSCMDYSVSQGWTKVVGEDQ